MQNTEAIYPLLIQSISPALMRAAIFHFTAPNAAIHMLYLIWRVLAKPSETDSVK